MSAKGRSDGDGSIYQRSDGKWVAAISLGKDHTGKRQRRTRIATNRKQAAAKLRELQAEAREGPMLVESHVTVAEWCRLWCDTIASQTVSPATQADYRATLERYVIPHLGAIELRNLTPEHYASLQQSLLDAGLAPNTVRHVRRPLSVCLNYAVRTGRLRNNPISVIPQPKLTADHAVRAKWLTAEDARRLVAVAEADSATMFGVVVFGLCRGLRRGEFLGLRWDDIDTDAELIHIRRRLREERIRGTDGTYVTVLKPGPPKTKTSVRDIAVDATVKRALSRLHTEQARRRLKAGSDWNDSGYVFTNNFGDPLWPSNVYRRFKKLIARHDLPDISLHDLRRTFANLAIEGDARIEQVSEALGHSSVEVTKSVYIGSSPALARRAFEQFDDFFHDHTPDSTPRITESGA
jgi:integrase